MRTRDRDGPSTDPPAKPAALGAISMPTRHLLDDGELLSAAQHGDKAAFATLYRMYNPYLDRRIRREIGSLPLEACDISQQAWALTFAATTSGSEIYNLFGYLRTVAGRIINAHRSSLADNPTESLEKL